jgi:AraC-like DNA-binding protein
MSLELLHAALDAANIFCAALFGIRVLASRPRNVTAQLIALLTITAICHVVLARYDYRAWIGPPYRIDVGAWHPILNFARNAAPGLFMIVIRRLFAENPRVPLWLLLLFAVQLFLEEPVRALLLPGSSYYHAITQIVPTALQLLFAGFALFWTVDNWRSDLVEERRRARALAAVVLGLNVVASSLLLRVLIPQNTAANYDVHLLLSVCNLLVIGFVIFRLMDGSISAYLEPDRPRTPARPNEAAEVALALSRLNTALEQEHIYRKPGLSLGALAIRAGLPEYRLRRLIHEQLGYRNFNGFLHHHRIREACELLRDDRQRRTPILTIALSVGYQSINTFNRAFREVTGMTPSAYRSRDAGGPGTSETA